MSAEEVRLNELKNEYKSYYKNYLLLLTLGLIWLIAAIVGSYDIQISILVLFLGITLFKPCLSFIGKLLGAPKIHKEESLKLLTRLIIIGILFGLIIGFFPFTENINLFFPTFTVIFGVIFGTIAYSTGLRTYAILAVILVAGGAYIGYYQEESFSDSGYFTAFAITSLGIINGIFGKKVRISFVFLRKKIKKNIGAMSLKTTQLSKKF
jgi:hypothetical protein